MLISVILQLITDAPGTLPPHLGRANYAATLQALNRVDAGLAQRLHDAEGSKPLTCSTLLGAPVQRDALSVHPGRAYALRITGMGDTVVAALDAALLQQTPGSWELDGHPFRVTGATCRPADHAWAGRTSFAAIAATALTQSSPAQVVTFEFASPTAFKSAGRTVPLPLPGLVFGSLVERWNSFSPNTLAGELRRYGEEMVVISKYRLESRAVMQKNDALRIGAVGSATYRALSRDRYWLSVMQMMAEFALYSGVGVQTATGMGQVRPLSSPPPARRAAL